MSNPWQEFLSQRSAVWDSNSVTHFGDRAKEIALNDGADVVADLSPLGTIQASGEDARSFLRSQFTNDVGAVTPAIAQWNGYCTAKGRLLALLRVMEHDNAFYLVLPRDVLPVFLKRLQMFVLRSKVKLTDVSEQWIWIGVAGSNAAAQLAAAQLLAPPEPNTVTHSGQTVVVKIPGPTQRFMVGTTREMAESLWTTWSQASKPVGYGIWERLDILAGLPAVSSKTTEEFIPQMLNLQAIGALSFTKGCYPGQEIVARTQYLGQLKRRLYVAHTPADNTPAINSGIFSSNDGGPRKVGAVVSAQPARRGGNLLLAVIEIAATDKPLFLDEQLSQALTLMELPYPVDTNKSS